MKAGSGQQAGRDSKQDQEKDFLEIWEYKRKNL